MPPPPVARPEGGAALLRADLQVRREHRRLRHQASLTGWTQIARLGPARRCFTESRYIRDLNLAHDLGQR
jgi:hypothetical protein